MKHKASKHCRYGVLWIGSTKEMTKKSKTVLATSRIHQLTHWLLNVQNKRMTYSIMLGTRKFGLFFIDKKLDMIANIADWYTLKF